MMFIVGCGVMVVRLVWLKVLFCMKWVMLVRFLLVISVVFCCIFSLL